MMSLIGFIMIAANGYASVVNASGQVPVLVEAVTSGLQSPPIAAALLLLLGLFVTLGIGSSFPPFPSSPPCMCRSAWHWAFLRWPRQRW